MTNVNNRRVIRRLAFRQVKSSGKMNAVVILSILLTCIMFTALFSIGGSIIKSFQVETMRQVGGSSMAELKYVLPEDHEKISADNAVKDPSYRIIVGVVANDEMRGISAEINYAQDESARSMFCYPTEGRMPKERNETAMSTLVLDALGIPHKLGETVTLKIDIDGEIVEEDFTLCGFWEGDAVAMAQQCFVSKEFCDEVAPTPIEAFYSNKELKYAGYWMVDFNFSNSWNIEQKLDKLMERLGYLDGTTPIDYGINWAYMTESVDMQTVAEIGAMLLLILIAGYLIIYNIFYINVTANIQSYGLLKTIGTTGRQLKRMVRYQALIYSMIGIPLGFLLGTLLSYILLPFITESLFMIKTTELSLNVPIYIAAAFFTLVTVFVSCLKPCKYAASVTPIEALRHSEATGKQKSKKTSKVSAFSMARNNLSRSRKKTAVVVLSLSLSIILLNSVYTMIRGLDVDKYVQASVIGDFVISDASLSSRGSGSVLETCGVKQDDLDYFASLDGVNEVSKIYYSSSKLMLDDTHYDTVISFMDSIADIADDFFENEREACRNDRAICCDIYGLNRSAFDLIMGDADDADAEKFCEGGYAVVYTYCTDVDEDSTEDDFYSIGETISLALPDGTVNDYEVMAIKEIPYALSSQAYNWLGAHVVIPDSDLTAHTKKEGAMRSVLNVDKDKMDSVEAEIEKYTSQIKNNLVYTSKQMYIEEFSGLINVFRMVGGALSVILAMIGILNFINAIVTGVFARQHEFAMMQAIGMTGRQLKTMLIWEGAFYAVFTSVFSFIIGSLVSRALIAPLFGQAFFFTYHFTNAPIFICIPLLILLSALIPFAAYSAICNGSVVDRLRTTE